MVGDRQAPERARQVDARGANLEGPALAGPSPFSLTGGDKALAETRAFNAVLERTQAAIPGVHEQPVEASRRMRREGVGVFPPPTFLPQAREVEIPGRAGRIRARVLAPGAGATGLYLHVHGGGWALGAADMQDLYLWQLVESTGLAVFSVEYRLAPEHPYPAGPDDAEDAALWLLEHGATALGTPPRFTIGGESAGAHLAAVTLLRLRDRHGLRDAFAAANLVYGVYDVTKTPSQERWGERNLMLSTPSMTWFAEAFLPSHDLAARRHPDVSPLYADLSDLPPAIFTVGTLDPLLDDSLFMETRWRAAGNESELQVWEQAVHGFNLFPLAAARAANAAQHGFLRRH